MNLFILIMKRGMKFWSLFLTFSVWLCAQAQPATPVRLAIVPESPEVFAVADMLTAGLSQGSNVQLLERAEIEKVYREQALSTANKDFLKLGRILGADGLLLFDVVRSPRSTNLTARLIAVKPGVVLADESFSWPLPSVTEWSSLFARHLSSFLPKLTVLAKDAIPISVVNLRAAVPSAEAQEAERELKLLTIQRLSQERQLFVLERQRMQLLSEEKELKSDNSAFWDGSYLLEGIVDQNGYSKETITINARLTPPKGGAPLLFEVSGSRTNYVEAINRLAAKVTELLKVNSSVKEWNAADEAEQYFGEANWALKWGIYSEAQAAADSAWALGKHDMEGALVRIRSYLADAKPADLNELYGQIVSRDETDTSKHSDLSVQEATNAATGEVISIFRRNGDVVSYINFKKQPDPLRFASAIRALELYKAQLNLLQSSDPATRKEWCELGTSLLATIGQWLRDYYLIRQSREEVETRLESARPLCRETATVLIAMPEANEESFWDAIGVFGVFWCETPEESVALYRKLFELRRFSSVRKHVPDCYPHFCGQLLLPVLTAWQEGDKNRIPRLWHDLVEEMCTSTNRELRGNGYFIVCAEADDAKTFLKALRIAEMCIPGDDTSHSYELEWLWSEGRNNFPQDQWQLAWQVPLDSTTEQQTQKAHSNTTQLLTLRSPTPVPHFQPPLTTNHPPPVIKPATVAPHKTETQTTNLLEVTRFWNALLPQEVRVEKYPDDKSSGVPSGSIVSFCYREGYLWVETEFGWYAENYRDGIQYEAKLVNQRAFFRVNLNTFTSECLPIDSERYHPQDSYDFAGPFRTFEVYSNHLYISSSDGIKRYSLARKTWEDLPVPVGGHARITAFDERIFLTSSSAIIEMSPDGQTSKVLASTRRRPAKTILDRMDNYSVKVAPDWNSCELFAPIIPGPDGSVVVFLKGQFYMLPKDAVDWVLWKEIPGSREAEFSFSPKNLLILSTLDVARPPMAAELYLARAGSTNINCIIADGPTASDWVYLNRIGVHRQEPPADWDSPEGMRVANWPACMDGNTMWVLYGPPKDLVLLHFVPGHTKPMSYHLHLKQSIASYASNMRFDWSQPYKWIQIEATPQGIVFGGAGAGSSTWFIPFADLQRIDPTGLSK